MPLRKLLNDPAKFATLPDSPPEEQKKPAVQDDTSAPTIPDPKRVVEIYRALVDDEYWPDNITSCPESRKECAGCPKIVCSSCMKDSCAECQEKIKRDRVTYIPPCARDVAHLAALYEARNKIVKNVVEERITTGNKLKCSRRRLPKDENLKEALRKSKRPKALRTYGKHRFKLKYLDWLKGRFTGKKKQNNPGNIELARFIFAVDELFSKRGQSDRNGIILAAIGVVEPNRGISEAGIIKTRTQYRHQKK